MIIASRLNKSIKKSGLGLTQLAGQISRSGLDAKEALTALRNWQRGLMKPVPLAADVDKLASALGVSAVNLKCWKSSYRYAPVSPTKARLVTALISGRDVQDALDILKFTNKRAASMVIQTLKTAIADADLNEADVESLVVCEARIDGGGIRLGTKRWRAKDRGRAHSIRKQCSHIIVTVAQEA